MDEFDIIPKDMSTYLRYNGRHFNRKLCKYAISMMDPTYVKESKKITKEEVDKMLENHSIDVDSSKSMYDYVYIANMCYNDFYGSSITDEKHLCLYIKDVIEDKDGYDGLVFNRWYADMCRKGIPIEWYDYI